MGASSSSKWWKPGRGWIGATAAAVLAGAGMAAAATLTLPNKFDAGSPAKASEVNANFDAVETAIDDSDAENDVVRGRVDVLEAQRPGGKTLVTTSSGLFPGAEGDIRTFSIATPGPGQVVLSMHGYFRMTHVLGTNSSINLWARLGTSKFRGSLAFYSGTLPSANPAIQPFAFKASFPVAAAGNYVITISGQSNVASDWGDCGAVVQGCPVVTLEYLPDTL